VKACVGPAVQTALHEGRSAAETADEKTQGYVIMNVLAPERVVATAVARSDEKPGALSGPYLL